TTMTGTWTATSTTGISGIASNTVKWYCNDATCGGAATLKATHSGLAAGATSDTYVGAAGSTYYYTVTAVNGVSVSSSASSNSATLGIDTTVPNTPTGLTASNTSGGGASTYGGATIYFNWSATSDNGGGSGIASNTVTWYALAACAG